MAGRLLLAAMAGAMLVASCGRQADEGEQERPNSAGSDDRKDSCSLRRQGARAQAGAGEYAAALLAYSAVLRECGRRHADASSEVLSWPADDIFAFAISSFHVEGPDAAIGLLRAICVADTRFCIEAARLCRSAGRFAEARDILTGALSRSAADFRVWLSLGLLFSSTSSYSLALRTFIAAHRLDTKDFKSLVNAAQTESNLGLKEKATQRLKHIHRQHPANVEVLLLLVEQFMNLDAPTEVVTYLNKALTLKPRDPEVLDMYARVMTKVRMYETAISIRKRIVRIYPDGLVHRCKLVQLAMSVAAWEEVEGHTPGILSDLRASPEMMQECLQPLEATMNPLCSEEDLQWVTRFWANKIMTRLPGVPQILQAAGQLPPPREEGGRELRVGYISSNLQGGAVFLMIQGLWKAHMQCSSSSSSSSSAVRVFTYSTVLLDPNQTSWEELDKLTTCRQLPYPSDRVGSAKIIRSDELDLLVNINGWCDTAANDLLFARLAGIQLSFMGYPGSMGSSTWTDVLVTDAIASPVEYQLHYTEKLLLLPFTYYLNDFQRVVPAVGSWTWSCPTVPSRLEHELPVESFVYVCFSRAEKIDKELFVTWMKVLRRTRGSVLWLLKDVKGRNQGETFISSHFRSRAEEMGVDSSRLIFTDSIDWKRHVERGFLADLFLDTLSYNAHSTGANVLWAGVPLLTWPRIKMASRVAASMNRAARAPMYTVRTLQEYEELAVKLCQAKRRSARMRDMVFSSRSSAPLFQTVEMTAALVRGYRIQREVLLSTGRHFHSIPSSHNMTRV